MTGFGQKVKEKLGMGAGTAEPGAEQATGSHKMDYSVASTDGAAYGAGSFETGTDVPVEQQTTNATEEAVCAAEYFTKVEDRPVVKERVENILEHRPVEKEFVVETRATGVERHTGVGEVEHLGTTERVVAVTPPSAPCE